MLKAECDDKCSMQCVIANAQGSVYLHIAKQVCRVSHVPLAEPRLHSLYSLGPAKLPKTMLACLPNTSTLTLLTFLWRDLYRSLRTTCNKLRCSKADAKSRPRPRALSANRQRGTGGYLQTSTCEQRNLVSRSVGSSCGDAVDAAGCQRRAGVTCL